MTAPDVRGAHTAQQAAIPPNDLIETDTTLGGTISVAGCTQRYVPARDTIYGPLPELEHLLELTDPDPPIQ